MALGMALLIVAGICAVSQFGKTEQARSSDSASGQMPCVRHASPRQRVGNTPATHRQAALSRAGSPAVKASQEFAIQRNDGPAAPLTSPALPLANAATPAMRSPQPSVAAALYANLSDAEFARMGTHEQAAVIELGAYAQEATQALDTAPPSVNSDPVAKKKRISSETDDYLRMTLGYAGFNQLSFLAAANRQTQAVGPSSTR